LLLCRPAPQALIIPVEKLLDTFDPDKWSSAFIALGLCGGSWIAATAPSERNLRVMP
jgi:hypothetical protein